MADGSLIFDTRLDDKGFKSGLEKLNGLAKTTFKGIALAVTAATVAMGAFSASTINVGLEFQAQMSRVQAISGATAIELEKLNTQAIKLGADTAFSAKEAAAGMENLASAGFSVNEITSAMPGLLDLAAVSGGNVAVASEIAAGSLRAFGLEASNAGHVADVFARAAADTNAEVADMGDAMTYFAPAAKSAGLSLETAAAAVGMLSDANIKGSVAGTTLVSVLKDLKPKSDEAAKAMSSIGFSAYDAQGQMKPLADIVDELKEKTSGMTQEQRDYFLSAMFGVEAQRGLNVLMEQGGEKLRTLESSFKNADGAAREMADVINNNLKGSIQEITGTFESFQIMVFEKISQPLRDLVSEADGYLKELSNSFKQGGFEGLSESFGKVLADALSSISQGFPQIIEMAFSMIDSFVQGIVNNLPILIPAAMQIVGTFIKGIGQSIPLLIEAAIQIIVQLTTYLSDNSSLIILSAINLIMIIGQSIITNLPIVIQSAIAIIMALAQGLITNLPLIIETAPRLINDFANAIYSQVPTLVMAGIQLILMLSQGLISAIPTLVSNLPQIILAIVNVFTLYNWASIGKNLITGIKEGAIAFKGNIITTIKDIGTNIAETFRYLLNGGGVRLIGQNMILAIKEGALLLKNTAVNSIKAIGTSIIDGIKSILSFDRVKSIGSDLVRGIGNGILNTKDWIFGVIKGFGDSIINKVKSVFGIKSPSRVMRDEVGKPIVQGIVVGIEKEQANLNKAIVTMSEEMLFKAKEEAKDYKEVGTLYSQFMKEGIEESGEQSINAITKLVNESIATLSAENDKASSEYSKAGKEVISAYTAAINDGVKEVQNEITKEVEKITAEAQKQYDEIIKKKEDMQSKLADFGELFVIDKETGKAVVQNINEQIDAIQRYDDVLSNLKSKGASDDFLNEVTKLGIDEGTRFGEALLALTDTQFEQYQAKWNEKQKLARDVASKFYKDQLATLEADFVNKLDSTLKSVPKIVENIGINAIQGMIDGMDSRKGAAIGKAKEIADAIIAEMQRAMDIHSPSRVMRDLIGKNIVKGIEVGIDEEKRNLVNKMKNLVLMTKEEMSMKVLGGSNRRYSNPAITNNNDNGVVQEINIYQPVKSPVEMMREAKRIGKELAYG